MAECIVLKGGGGADLDVVTAGKSDVLAGKVIVDKEGEPLSGIMPNRGAVNQTLNAGGSYSIPAGYHNGAGKVTANSLASQTPGNADSGSILSGRSAWVNGVEVDGAIPVYNGNYWNANLGVGMESDNLYSFAPYGYHAPFDNRGTLHRIPIQRVRDVTGVSANKIIEGQNIAGVWGSVKDYSYLANGQTAF